MKILNSNLKTFNCKKCKKVVAFIKDGSKLKKGIVFLCEECYDTMESGNLFNNVFGGVKMNVLDIITKYLKENGYDGLYYERECGCHLDDLCPCGEISLNCQPGYKVKAPESSEYDWYICPTKNSEPWKND